MIENAHKPEITKVHPDDELYLRKITDLFIDKKLDAFLSDEAIELTERKLNLIRRALNAATKFHPELATHASECSSKINKCRWDAKQLNKIILQILNGEILKRESEIKINPQLRRAVEQAKQKIFAMDENLRIKMAPATQENIGKFEEMMAFMSWPDK